MSSKVTPNAPSGIITAGSGGGGGYVISNTAAPIFTNSITSDGTERFRFNADGTTSVNGDLVINGKSIGKSIEKIEERLSILVPDPKKLERYEALKIAYEQYKMMEALLNE